MISEDILGSLSSLPGFETAGRAKVVSPASVMSPKEAARFAQNNAPEVTGPIDEYVLTAYKDGSESTWEFNPPTDWSNMQEDIRTINHSSTKKPSVNLVFVAAYNKEFFAAHHAHLK